jgi:hypothetical protein
MEEWMIGLMVTVGLKETGIPTIQVHIDSYSETHITLVVSGKKKKFEYDPIDIQFCVYQFATRLVFSNDIPAIIYEDDEDDVVDAAVEAIEEKETKKKLSKADLLSEMFG